MNMADALSLRHFLRGELFDAVRHEGLVQTILHEA